MKIIQVPFQVLFLALRYKGSLSEKISVFRTLLSLKLNKLISGKGANKECTQKILNYSVTGHDYSTLHTLFYDIFLSPPYLFKSKNEKPLIIDCGAHIGMSVLYFKNLFPNSKIIAIEANPHAYRLLKKNIAINNLRDVTTYNAVLGSKKGSIPFYISGNKGTINGSVHKDIGRENEITSDGMLLSEIISGYTEKIDLVKLDVEGAEAGIVAELGSASMLGVPDQYIIEYHHRTNNDPSRLADFLKKFELQGYDYNLWSRSQIDKCQDILIHFYK